jgi:molecular chaperone HtpG
MDDAEQLMPPYLRFVRGVIDSNDLPLNVSREILQQSRDVEAIRATAVKRVLGLLEDLATKEQENFATAWKEFGRVLKEGVVDDPANRDRIAKLLRFASTRLDSQEQTVALAEYVSRMKEKQEAIYYITADGYQAARNSPHLEIFRKLGVEVLLLFDRVDEWLVASLTEFEGKPLQSVAKGGLDVNALGGAAAEDVPGVEPNASKALVERMGAALSDRASSVRISLRLTDSPACLVSDGHGMSTHLERMLKAAGQEVPASKPVLEINATHPITQRIGAETDEQRFRDWSQLLFDQATLAEGGQLADPAGFVRRLNELMLSLAGHTASKIWVP